VAEGGGGGGGGKPESEKEEDVAWVEAEDVAGVKVAGVKVEEEDEVKERYEEMCGGGGRDPVTRDGELLAGTCAAMGSTHSPGGGGSGRERMSEGSTNGALRWKEDECKGRGS
jgi:hypothetical protein